MKIKTWLIRAALVMCFLGSTMAFAQTPPGITKTLVSGPNPIEAKLPNPTTFVLQIDYISNGGPAVVIHDAIPAEFTNVAVNDDGVCSPLVVISRGKGLAGATTIACSLEEGENASLIVTFETRRNPGRGHRQPVYKPTKCEPLLLNDGAVAIASAEEDPEEIIAGPTAPLIVEVIGCDEEEDNGPTSGVKGRRWRR